MTATLFHFEQDASSPFTERLEWLTDVSTMRDGTETRRALRQIPRRTLSYDVTAFESERDAVLDALRYSPGDAFFPIWPFAVFAPEKPLLGATDKYLAFGPGLEPTVCDQYLSVPPGARITVPLAAGRLLSGASISHITDTILTVAVSAQLYPISESVPAFVCPTGAAGRYALRIHSDADGQFMHDWEAAVAETVSRDSNVLDNGIVWGEDLRHTERRVTYGLALRGRAQIQQFRAFLYAMAGRRHSFYHVMRGDTEHRVWRLDSDAHEIIYDTTDHASARVAFKELVNE